MLSFYSRPKLQLYTLFAVLFTTVSIHAQDVQVSFRIVNSKKEPVGFATVSLRNRVDSTNKFEQVADSTGRAQLTLTKGAQYIVAVTSVNYQPMEKGITATGQPFTLALEPLATTLGGVVVRSTRPLMRQEDDKTIVDPEALIPSSTSGYEVIEKTPGLFVDQDGNIYIASTTPATVMINGREMKMSAADIATMLKSLPPNAIASIEIVRTPSAKYDATSSGGMVNVILKKGVKLGLTGSVNSGWQQGTYGTQFAGFNLTNNNGELSTYLNVNVNNRNSFDRIKTDRIFAPDSVLSQDANTKYPSDIYYVGFGMSFEASKKWQLSYDGRFSLNQFDNKTENLNIIRKLSTAEIIASNINLVRNLGHTFTTNHGINAKNKLDSLGSEWTSDVSYTYARNESEQSFSTGPTSGGDGDAGNHRHFLTAQSDVTLKMKKKFTFEAGIKTSLLSFDNETEYFSLSGGTRTKDELRTNTFRYRENINSAYVQGSKTIVSDLLLKTGLRVENTNMNGHQVVPGDTTFSIHRTDLFPYAYLSKKVISIAGFELRAYLVYRRTISRPVYEQLNPFPRYIDQFLSEVGNPTLRPQFNNNYEANISVNEMPILAVGINQTKDIFTNVIYSLGSQAFRTYDNLGKNKEFYLRGLGAIPPGGKYFFVLGGQYNHNHYEGFYQDRPLAFKKGTWTFFTYHQLKLGKRSQFTMNGFIRLKGQLQFYELSTFGALNASINRQFLKQKLIVTLSMNDMFYTLRNDFTLNQGPVNASGSRYGDTRRIGINLRYNFGIRKKEETNNMFTVDPEKVN
ncbi:MAG: TonB-dependent receptor [Chitinophagaceae bacterium]|nr:TonB-dependent receptor [Chitinophagaceae bacterium]